jgi:hypothetical protein
LKSEQIFNPTSKNSVNLASKIGDIWNQYKQWHSHYYVGHQHQCWNKSQTESNASLKWKLRATTPKKQKDKRGLFLSCIVHRNVTSCYLDVKIFMITSTIIS